MVYDIHLRKTNMDTQNDGLEKVTNSLKKWQFWVSMLAFGGVIPIELGSPILYIPEATRGPFFIAQVIGL